ncbi:MAG: molybdate ABC transporter substrate-binding protein [Rubrivivax sp.]|nr:MAG: molybdate ABC transporter substrate-binding protein [Rubrivivax sp.]
MSSTLPSNRYPLPRALFAQRFLALALATASGLASAQAITVSAAASLQNAMREIGTAYQAAHPGSQVHFNFAASGPLLAQIAQGAPVDAFASADQDTMDKAQSQGLVKPDTRFNFAANELVLISPLSQAASLKALPDLKRVAIGRIAVGNPLTVPAGRYAQAALTQQGLWPALSAKLVFADNVRQALNYVSRAEVDAGFVYRTDALLEQDKVRIDFAVPTPKPVLYPMALVAASPQPAMALDFMKFVASPPGQALLKKHGFAPAP